MTKPHLDEFEFGSYKGYHLTLQTLDSEDSLSYRAFAKHDEFMHNLSTEEEHDSPQSAISKIKGMIDSGKKLSADNHSASDNAAFDVHQTDPARLKEETKKDLKRGRK